MIQPFKVQKNYPVPREQNIKCEPYISQTRKVAERRKTIAFPILIDMRWFDAINHIYFKQVCDSYLSYTIGVNCPFCYRRVHVNIQFLVCNLGHEVSGSLGVD